MKNPAAENKRTIEMKIGAGNIRICFSNEESQGVRDTIMGILTISYEQRIQAQLEQLCRSLEPNHITAHGA